MKYTRFTNLEADNLRVPGVPYVVKLGDIKYSATSGTAATIGTISGGLRILKMWCDVTTAFNSGTSDTIKIGTSDDDDAFMATSDITTHTVGAYKKDLFVKAANAITVKATLTKTGTTATAGLATVYAMVAEE